MKIELEKKPLAQGRQGRIFDVVSVNGVKRKDLVAKEYYSKGSHQRTRSFINHINEKNLRAEPSLECLPFEYFKLNGKTAIIMRKAHGRELEKSYKSLCRKPLSQRIALSWQSSRGIFALHKAGIINGDIHPANVMLNKDRIWIIDVDGGGISEKKIEPVIRGHEGGSYMAPELFFDESRLPTVESDRWSLAVLNHMILVPGIDPFYFLDKYADIRGLREWPPKNVQRHHQEIAGIQESIAKACYPLFDLLKVTFNEGICNPSRRSRLDEYATVSERCLARMIACPACAEEMMAQEKCPFCGQFVSGITLKMGMREIPLNSSRVTFTTSDFGQSDDMPVVTFEAKNDSVFCMVKNGIPVKYGGKTINANDIIHISADQPRLIELSCNNVKLNLIVQKKALSVRNMTGLISGIKSVNPIPDPNRLPNQAGKSVFSRIFGKIKVKQ